MISIYIISFNRISTTLKCLSSLREHLRCEYEVVLVENHSIDAKERSPYRHLLDVWPAMRIVELNQPRHCPWIRAQVLQHARGDYIFFLDDDCFVENDFFPQLIAELNRDERVGGISPGLLYYPTRTYQCLGITLERMEENLFHPKHLCHNEAFEVHRHRAPFTSEFLPGGCSLFRRSFLEQCSYDERLKNVFGDFDLCLQGKEKGWHYKFHPACYLLHDKTNHSKEYLEAKSHQTDWLGGVKLFEAKWGLRYYILKHIEEGRVVLENGQFPRWLPRAQWPENRMPLGNGTAATRKKALCGE